MENSGKKNTQRTPLISKAQTKGARSLPKPLPFQNPMLSAKKTTTPKNMSFSKKNVSSPAMLKSLRKGSNLRFKTPLKIESAKKQFDQELPRPTIKTTGLPRIVPGFLLNGF